MYAIRSYYAYFLHGVEADLTNFLPSFIKYQPKVFLILFQLFSSFSYRF